MTQAPRETRASDRVRLARLALDAALVVPDVLGAEAGLHGVHVTADPPAGPLRGVSVIAQSDGRYAVDLRLVAGVVPLVALGEEVRRRVQASAGRGGLADRLGTVNVEFARLLTPEEARREIEDARGGAGAGAASTRPAATSAVFPAAPAAVPRSPGPGATGEPGRAASELPPSSSSAPPARPPGAASER
jgi:hypothetical protein